MASYEANPDHNINVATVCGNEVRVFGDVPRGGGPRPFLRRISFPHHGAALLWAAEHDEAERVARARRQSSGVSLA